MTITVSDRIKRLSFLIPLAIATVIFLSFYALPALTADGHIYLQIARNIHLGIGLGWQALWFSPLHSILIALAGWIPGVHNLQAAAGIVSTLMGILLSIAVYFLAAGIFNRTVAIAAAVLTTTFPHIIFISASTEPEITYTTFLIASLALLVAAVKRESIPLAVMTGVFFSFAYLTRSEGFLVMVLILAVLCATAGIHFYNKAIFRLSAVILVAFLLTSSPYLIFLQKHYGAFVISPKATYVLIWMKSRIYNDNDKGEKSNDELWGLAPDGKLMWQHPSGIRDVVAYLMSHPAKSMQVYLHNLSMEIPGRIPNNSGCQHFPQVFPIYFVFAALFFVFRKSREHSLLCKSILFAPFLLLLILPVFTEGWWKYLVPYTPLLIIAACAGLFQAVVWLTPRIRLNSQLSVASMITLVFSFLMAVYYLSFSLHKPTTSLASPAIERNNYNEASHAAALGARQYFGPGHNYLVVWNKMIYYLDGLWTPEPITDFKKMIQFARQNSVEYIIKEIPDQSVSVEDMVNVPPEVKLAWYYHSPLYEYTAVIYRLVR